MTASIEILQLGAPVLRQMAAPVPDPTDPSVRDAAARMIVAMQERALGLGLAAPQVGISARFFVMCCQPSALFPDAPEIAPTVVVNPTIRRRGPGRVSFWERCLSVPGIRGRVPRDLEIDAVFQDDQGAERTWTLRGLPAIVFQHELDHLDGLVFLDRLASLRDIIAESEYQKLNVEDRVLVEV